MKTRTKSAIAASLLALSLLGISGASQAWNGHGGGWNHGGGGYYRGGYGGGWVAPLVLGGFVGAAIASNYNASYYQQPVYLPPPVYAPQYVQQIVYVDQYGNPIQPQVQKPRQVVVQQQGAYPPPPSGYYQQQ